MALRSVGVAIALACATAVAAPPDLTGVWTNAGRPGIGGATGPAATPIPLKPEAKTRVDAYQALVSKTGDTPGGVCLGTGMPGSMLGSGGYPMEIIQRPEQITIVYEAHSEVRRIYFGARNAEQRDRVPGRNGYSSGRWEGNTLVVETDNLVDQVDQRYAHSDEAKIVERYTLAGKDDQGRNVLKVEMTMTDPKFLTAPFKMEKSWAQVPNGRVLPYECNEENWTARLEELAHKAGVELP
ncbi:MAG: hypothetical protein ABW136_05170 [Steroidobacteraceae bacterium]